MAERQNEFLAAGARLAAVDVDTPGQHAAMVEKLGLPFPYLSDPDRDLLIGPLGLRDERDPREIALPAVVVVGADGEEAWRWVSRDYADRIDEADVLDVVRGLGLSAVDAEEMTVGAPEPGPKAVDVETLHVYFRGARFAVVALRRRHETVRDDGMEFIREMDRYLEVLKKRRTGGSAE